MKLAFERMSTFQHNFYNFFKVVSITTMWLSVAILVCYYVSTHQAVLKETSAHNVEGNSEFYFSLDCTQSPSGKDTPNSLEKVTCIRKNMDFD